MSLARVTTINKSAKPYECEKCHAPLPAGSAYRWYKVGFRARYRHIRCMAIPCTPRASELEGSKLSEVYSAQEDALASLDDLGEGTTADEITEVVTALGEAIQAVADEYAEASTDDNGTVFNTTAEERGEALSSAADDLSNFAAGDAEEDCTDCGGTGNPECEVCGGYGEVGTKTCAECAGDGHTDEECETCSGTGQVFDVEAAVEEAREAISGIEV